MPADNANEIIEFSNIKPLAYRNALVAIEHWEHSDKQPAYVEHVIIDKLKAASEKIKDSDKSLKAEEQIYRAIGTLYKEIIEEKVNDNTESAAKFRDLLPELGALATAFYPRSRRIALDITAQPNVHQGEVGFSSEKPLVTDNILSDIAVAIRDPETNRTALIRVDSLVDEKALEQIWKKFPEPTAEKPLEVRLIGGNTSSPLGKPTAQKNTGKIVNFLSGHHVKILSIEILKNDQPRSVVIDPKKFEFEELKTLELEEAILHEGARAYQFNSAKRDETPSNSLNIAFDDAVSENRMAAVIPSNGAKRILEIHGLEVVPDVREYDGDKGGYTQKAYKWMKKQVPEGAYDTARWPAVVDQTEMLFEQQVQFFDKIKKLVNGMDTAEKQEVLEELSATPFYVGANAAALNNDILKKVQNAVAQFSESREPKESRLNTLREAIENIETAIPLEKLDAAIAAGKQGEHAQRAGEQVRRAGGQGR